MTDDQILGLMKEALEEVAPGKGAALEGVGLQAPISDLNLDSVTTMEMLGSLEERLDTTFPDEDLVALHTFGDVAKLVRGATA